MSQLENYTNEIIKLHAFVLTLEGKLVDQPINYPKITIDKITDTGKVNIVPETVMIEDVNGEYYYSWDTTGLAVGYYKARYEGIIEGESAFGFDSITIRDRYKNYEGYGV